MAFSPAKPTEAGRVLWDKLGNLGLQLAFYAQVIRYVPTVVLRQKRELLRVIGELAMSSGSLARIGGAMVIVAFVTGASGTTAIVVVWDVLEDVGITGLSGLASAIISPRLLGGTTAAVTMVVTVGAGITAQLGSMRVAEEIDALDVMAIPSIAYLASTRFVAGLIICVPLFLFSVVAAFVGFKVTAVYYFGLPEGVFDHYLDTYLQLFDIWVNIAQAVAFTAALVLVHSYYGYTASGGPAGVGLAVARSVRVSLAIVLGISLAISIALYAGSDVFRVSG